MNYPDTKPFKTTHRAFVAVVIFFFVALGVYSFIFYTLMASSRNGASLQKQIAGLEVRENEVGTLKKELSDMEGQQKTLSSYFIDANDIVPFLDTVEGYGKTTNVVTKFDSFDIKNNPNRLEVSLVADGSFTDLYRFLGFLENAPYAISISKMDLQLSVPLGLQPSGTSSKTTGWEARVNLSVVSITGTK